MPEIVKSESFLDDIDLMLTVLFTLFCMLFILVPFLKETPLMIVLGFALAIFIPGYSLVAAFFTRRDDLCEIERVALSFGLSIIVVPLLGLILNFTPFGIRLAPLLIILSTFTISLSLIAWFRRMKLPAKERFRVPFERLLKVNLGQTVLDKGLSIILIASIIGSSATLVYVAVTPKTGEKFTEFYLLNQNGTASDYPTDLKVGEEEKVIIGIVNHEYENITYHLEINFNGSVIHKASVLLIENEKIEIPFTFKAIKKGENLKLEFLLYKNQQREAYRKLHLWISITHAHEIVSDFEIIDDWTLTMGDSITIDTINFKEGNQGISLRSIDYTYTVTERAINLNALGKHFELWAYVNNLTNLSHLYIEFEVDAPWSRYFRTPNLRYTNILTGWTKFGLSRASFEAMGGTIDSDWANVTKVRMRVRSVAGTTVNVTFDDFRMIRDQFAGKITLRFDDACEDTYTESRARMDEYGFPGVAFVPTNYIGKVNRLTFDQCKHLQKSGWDIVSHSVTHRDLTTLTPTEVDKELRDSQQWLVENGFYKGSRFFSSYGNKWDPTIKKFTEKYYLASQVSYPLYDTIPPANQYRMCFPIGVGTATPLVDVTNCIDKAKECQAWLTISFHSIADVTDLFQDIIDYIDASGLEVVTFSDVFDEMIRTN